MVRAGIFIGVDQTGGLQRLRDAASGARRMHDWALGQGIKPENATLITDEGGRVVTPDDVLSSIKKLLDGPGADQLIVYFAGHGVNIARNEHWLLTEAPEKSWAAVDVTGTADAARYCGIRHVVFISDACRVAPEGIQAQGVEGQMVVPNVGLGGPSQPVDLFYACLLGRTAAETADPSMAVRSYKALYTNALLDALSGHKPDVLERSGADGDLAGYVKPRRLKSFLRAELPARIRALQLATAVNQEPDAIITSDGEWLARVDPFPAPAPPGASLPPAPEESAIGRGAVEEEPALGPSPGAGSLDPVGDLTRTVLVGAGEQFRDQLGGLHASPVPGQVEVAETIETVAEPFGPDHFETGCGVKVRGARIAGAVGPEFGVEPLTEHLVRLSGGPASVVITFEDGSGTVVPALPDFLTGLTVENGELVDVSFEPSANSGRWQEFHRRAEDIRVLRSVAASASRSGRFDLEPGEAARLALSMQLGKGVDPTLAVYAAYAYYDVQLLDRISGMSSHLRNDVGVSLFDVGLLARELTDRRADRAAWVVPFTPLMTRGWSFLRSHRVDLPGVLAGLSSELLDSPWCLYTGRGLARLTRALTSGDVR